MFHFQTNRRLFLKNIAGSLAVGSGQTLLKIDVTAAESANLHEQPMLRFVQWNDIHVRSPRDTNKSQQKLDYLISSINNETYFPKPDFVIGVGDLIEGGSAAARKNEFDIFKDKVDGLKCLFYPVVGNHENNGAEGNPTREAEYVATFGSDRLNYTFQAGGIQFIVLNNSGSPGANKTSIGKKRRKWLQKKLDESPGLPKIITCHIPLVPMRDEQVLAESFGFGKLYCTHDADLLKIVEDHADDVLAVLSGHVHLSGAVQRKGVYHITTSGTDDYPCDFAEFAVYKDRLHVHMHAISKDLREPSRNLHTRSGTEYTDSTHATAESYVSGNDSEREFIITLREKTLLPTRLLQNSRHNHSPFFRKRSIHE